MKKRIFYTGVIFIAAATVSAFVYVSNERKTPCQTFSMPMWRHLLIQNQTMRIISGIDMIDRMADLTVQREV